MSESRTPTSTPFMKGSSYDRIRKTRSSNCSTSSRDFVAYSGPSSPRAARPTTPCRRRSDDVESAGQRTIRRIRPSSARTDRCPRCSCGGRVVDELHAISRAIMSRYFSVAGSSGANNLPGERLASAMISVQVATHSSQIANLNVATIRSATSSSVRPQKLQAHFETVVFMRAPDWLIRMEKKPSGHAEQRTF